MCIIFNSFSLVLLLSFSTDVLSMDNSHSTKKNHYIGQGLFSSDNETWVGSKSSSKTNTVSGKSINGKLHVSYKQFAADTAALAERLKNEKFVGIVAVARGGLIPAGILAQKLNIHRVKTVCIKSYTEDDTQSDAEILEKFESEDRWLVVDDLVDSGKTFEIIKKWLPNSYFAATYAKPKGKLSTNIYQKECPQSTWIVFPWGRLIRRLLCVAILDLLSFL